MTNTHSVRAHKALKEYLDIVEGVEPSDANKRPPRHDDVPRGYYRRIHGWMSAVILILFLLLTLNGAQHRDELMAMQIMLDAREAEVAEMRAERDAWTCTYDRSDKRSALGIVKSCIKMEGI